jgi:hypothetical protein
MEIAVSADMPRGEYILYLLRIPVGVDLLTNPEQWMVGVSSFKVELWKHPASHQLTVLIPSYIQSL